MAGQALTWLVVHGCPLSAAIVTAWLAAITADVIKYRKEHQ